jgi:hypothetical protein
VVRRGVGRSSSIARPYAAMAPSRFPAAWRADIVNAFDASKAATEVRLVIPELDLGGLLELGSRSHLNRVLERMVPAPTPGDAAALHSLTGAPLHTSSPRRHLTAIAARLGGEIDRMIPPLFRLDRPF